MNLKTVVFRAALILIFPFVTLPARILGFMWFFFKVGLAKGYKTAAKFVNWAYSN